MFGLSSTNISWRCGDFVLDSKSLEQGGLSESSQVTHLWLLSLWCHAHVLITAGMYPGFKMEWCLWVDPGLTIEQLKYPDMCMHWETWLHWSTMGILLKHMTLMGGSARRPRGTTVHLWYSKAFFFFSSVIHHSTTCLIWHTLFYLHQVTFLTQLRNLSSPRSEPAIFCLLGQHVNHWFTVCGIVVLLLCILIDLVRSALLPRKKKMIIKQSGKHLRPGLKYRTAPLLLWTFSS